MRHEGQELFSRTTWEQRAQGVGIQGSYKGKKLLKLTFSPNLLLFSQSAARMSELWSVLVYWWLFWQERSWSLNLVLNITANSYGTESEVIHLSNVAFKVVLCFLYNIFFASVTHRLSTLEPCETSRLVVRKINLGSRNYGGGKRRRAEVSSVGSKQQKTAFVFEIE